MLKKVNKKLIVVAPLSCMLTGGIDTFPTPANALAVTSVAKHGEELPQSVRNLYLGIDNRIIHALQNRDHEVYARIAQPITYQLDYHVTGENFHTKAKTNSYTPAGEVELLLYKNASHVVQTQKTIAKQVKFSESLTYSDKFGAKLGLSLKSKISVGIPFVGEGGTEITANTEYSYEHTNSNTTGKETTITFPSQEIVCEPGYITKYVGRVQSATFSGELSGKAEVTGSIKIWVQNMKTFKIEQKEIDIDDIFKYTNSDIQQGLAYEYHAEENAVYITVNIPYTGLGGHYQTVDVEVTPIGKEHDPKAKRRMPLNIYQEKVNKHTVKDLW